MAKERAYRDLKIWQLGMELAERVYRLTDGFPKSEQYGLTSQLRGAAVSIPANIAEGYGRGSNKNLANFVRISRGSLAEVETLAEPAVRLGYVESEEAEPVAVLFGAIGRKAFMFLKAIDPSSVREAGAEYSTGTNGDSEASDSNAIDRN
jgi:four helix bundle protein